MFRILSRGTDGDRRPVPVVTILGSDHRLDRNLGDLGIAEGAWETLRGSAESVWPESSEFGLGALDRLIAEARESSLLRGTTPETWSPLATITGGDVGEFNAYEGMVDVLAEPYDRQGRVIAVGHQPDQPAELYFDYGGEAVAALSFCADRFVALLPPGTETVDFRYDPDDDFQLGEWEAAGAVLRDRIPNRAPKGYVLWRSYVGAGTAVTDGWDRCPVGRFKRLRLSAVQGTSWVVGRMGMQVSRRKQFPTDPLRIHRLRRFEVAHGAAATNCPSLSAQVPVDGAAVVAVHGTMACGVPMAHRLREILGTDVPIFRFEHDTWIPVLENVEELVDRLAKANGPLLLVAHSRGGLIARHAADILRRNTPSRHVTVITLGTPFLGTPFVTAVRGGVVGVRGMMGLLRLDGGLPALDAATRLASLMLKGLPAGILAMEPRSAYLSGFLHYPPSVDSVFGGDVVPESVPDGYGLAGIQGIGLAAFGGLTNDLIVPTDSALGGAGGPPPVATTLSCDHFSYMKSDAVADAIRAVAGGWRSTI